DTCTSSSGMSVTISRTPASAPRIVGAMSARPGAKPASASSTTTTSPASTRTRAPPGGADADTSSSRYEPSAAARACVRASSAPAARAMPSCAAASAVADPAGAAAIASSRGTGAVGIVASASRAGASPAAGNTVPDATRVANVVSASRGGAAGVRRWRAAAEPAADTITNAKSCRTMSLKVTSQPKEEASSPEACADGPKRRSGRALMEQHDATRLARGGADVRAHRALDLRRIGAAVDELDARRDESPHEQPACDRRLQLRRERQHDRVREERAVERRQHRDPEPGTDRRDVAASESRQHVREPDERSDEPERREELSERGEHLARGLAVARLAPRLAVEQRGELVGIGGVEGVAAGALERGDRLPGERSLQAGRALEA